MDLSSVLSIGGSAVSFFPYSPITGSSTPSPPSSYYTYYASRNETNSTSEIHMICKAAAAKIRARYDWQQKEGVPGSPFRTGKARRGALFCRSGTWLEILNEPPENSVERETIRGSSTENTKYGVLEFISVAIGLISIRGVQSNRFLCMNHEGSLYSTPLTNFSAECVFMEEMMENYYNLYSSCTYGSRKRPWYVALRRTGIPRKGKNTRRRRKASHFLVIHYEGAAFVQNYGNDEERANLTHFLNSSLQNNSSARARFNLQRAQQGMTSSFMKQEQKKKHLKTQNISYKSATRDTKNKKGKKGKSRREERLNREEERRQQRREEIRSGREYELKKNKERMYGDNPRRQLQTLPFQMLRVVAPTTPRLSGAGLQIRPRRITPGSTREPDRYY